MKIKAIDVFSESSIHTVVRLPGRKYLGSVLPGDSLFLLHAEAMDVVEELKHNPDSDVFYKAYSLAKNLEDMLMHYIGVCDQHGIELGLKIECSVRDYQELMYQG